MKNREKIKKISLEEKKKLAPSQKIDSLRRKQMRDLKREVPVLEKRSKTK